MPVLRLFTDLTINGGWNLCAIMFYAMLTLIAASAIHEHHIRKGK